MESIYKPEDLPLAVELQDRKQHCKKLRAFFLAHPGEELTSEQLREEVGNNFQQRVSDLRLGRDGSPRLHIACLPQYLEAEQLVRGKYKSVRVRRLEGHYIYKPYEPLGVDAATPRAKSPAIQKDLPL